MSANSTSINWCIAFQKYAVYIYIYIYIYICTCACKYLCIHIYMCVSVSTGNTFQDLPRLRETVDNTERYI
jgi:hypothetical protein